MNKTLKLVLIVFAVAALFALAFWGYGLLSEKYSPEEAPEQKEELYAVDFAMEDINGEQVRLFDFKGKPTVVNFWATWCGPCKAEMPHFEKAYSEYGDKINFLMVNLTDGSRDTPESVKEFLKESGYKFPVYLDVNYEGAYTYGVSSVPATLFINEKGVIIGGYMGAMSESALYNSIDILLKGE